MPLLLLGSCTHMSSNTLLGLAVDATHTFASTSVWAFYPLYLL